MLYAYLYSTSVLLCLSMMHRESGYDSEVDPIVKLPISTRGLLSNFLYRLLGLQVEPQEVEQLEVQLQDEYLL